MFPHSVICDSKSATALQWQDSDIQYTTTWHKLCLQTDFWMSNKNELNAIKAHMLKNLVNSLIIIRETYKVTYRRNEALMSYT